MGDWASTRGFGDFFGLISSVPYNSVLGESAYFIETFLAKLKGLGHEMNNFLRPTKFNPYFMSMRR